MRNDAPATVSDLEIVAEKTYQNSKKISQNDRQRRDEFVDLYGIEFYRQGDADSPAVFRVSVSGDAAYMERFQFKLVIEPYQVSSKIAVSQTSLTTNGRSLSVSNDNISPNPHTHTIDAHTHDVVAGIANVTPSSISFTIECNGIDITAYLRAQCEENGWTWPNGVGVFPSTDLEESFDLMEVACDMEAEGNTDDARAILRQGWKPITLTGTQPFSATMVLYLKYQHMNR